jgi:hypothetical protein
MKNFKEFYIAKWRMSSLGCLSSFSWNYFWFMQYIVTMGIFLMRGSLWVCTLNHFILVYNSNINYYIIVRFHSFVPSFVCSYLWFLFTNFVTVFATLKGRKQCLPLRFLFQDDADSIAYLTMDHPKSLKKRRK